MMNSVALPLAAAALLIGDTSTSLILLPKEEERHSKPHPAAYFSTLSTALLNSNGLRASFYLITQLKWFAELMLGVQEMGWTSH